MCSIFTLSFVIFFLRCVGVMNYNFIQVWASGQKIKYRRASIDLLSTVDRICLLHLFFHTIEILDVSTNDCNVQKAFRFSNLLYFFFCLSIWWQCIYWLNGKTYARATQNNCRRKPLKVQHFTIEKIAKSLSRPLFFFR